ncbi:hypothetical protein AMELA_G00019050 [Ameiurus melas]|uniref:Uncharacterized protein n=1 Tax=Ameiurus melas TaxID=219545 RepID=A0A7J6BB44_AMEME|nr:hypothetical protein AMELA_G00019050 [Ameiurus melas]
MRSNESYGYSLTVFSGDQPAVFHLRHADRGKAIARIPNPFMDPDIIYFCSCVHVFCYIRHSQAHCHREGESGTSIAHSSLIY